MKTKHQHYEFIKAFIDGEEVEFTCISMDGAHTSWQPATRFSIFDNHQLEFRLKPQKKKSVGYRRYLSRCMGNTSVFLCYENFLGKGCAGDLYFIQRSDYFIRWIDTEWQYEEYEE